MRRSRIKKIATITFNRPEKLNAATTENREELKAKVVQKEMMLTGTPLTVQEAAECGLINRVVPEDKLEAEVNKLAETIAAQPFDAIVMGKAFFEAALEAMGVGTGYSIGYMSHTLQTNIHYEPDEFNLFRMSGKKGIKGALQEREAHYPGAPLARTHCRKAKP